MSDILTMNPKRLTPMAYLQLVIDTFLRHWKAITLPLLAVFILSFFVRVDINITESLPDHVFLTFKGWTSNIKHGDYIAFRWLGGGPFPKGFHMVKIVAGVSGDVVSMDKNGGFWLKDNAGLEGNYLGLAKPRSRTGEALQPGRTGVIPAEHYYVMAPHKDSLDSRYALMGWVAQDQLIGKTFALF